MTLLTVKEFADQIRMHPRSVYRRIWRDQLPGVYRVGRDIRIDPSEALQDPDFRDLSPTTLSTLFTRV